MMHDNLKGRVALITGASRGIGRAIANTLARRGCDLVLVARSEKELQETATLCETYGGRALPLTEDLTDRDAPARILKACIDQYGHLDFLINNAGKHHFELAQTQPLDTFAQVMEVNLMAIVNLTQTALPWLAKSDQAAIVQIASIAGKMSFRQGSAYCASKHALLGYTNALFEDVREQGIKVCAINPGFVNTDMATSPTRDSAKMIQPDDISRAVLFVISFPQTACPTEITIRPQLTPVI